MTAQVAQAINGEYTVIKSGVLEGLCWWFPLFLGYLPIVLALQGRVFGSTVGIWWLRSEVGSLGLSR